MVQRSPGIPGSIPIAQDQCYFFSWHLNACFIILFPVITHNVGCLVNSFRCRRQTRTLCCSLLVALARWVTIYLRVSAAWNVT